MKNAENLNFWKTGSSSPDIWIERTKKQIENLGGKVKGEGFGSDDEGRAAYMVAFKMENETFKIIWPVMISSSGNDRAARIQAATSLYHYVKAVCLYAVVVGHRVAFFSHLMLPGGQVASQIADDQISLIIPKMLLLKEGGDAQ